jgi:hypothetical protein
MLTAEISTSTPTRFEPPWFSSEELGETIESLRRQSRRQRSLSTEPPTVMSGAAECVYVNVEHETPARNLQVFRQAWSGAQGMLSMEPRAIVFSRAPYPTAITSRTVKQLADVIESALSSIAKASAEKPAVVEQEFELIVTPESKQVRHVTARIVSRGRGEPNPVLD